MIEVNRIPATLHWAGIFFGLLIGCLLHYTGYAYSLVCLSVACYTALDSDILRFVNRVPATLPRIGIFFGLLIGCLLHYTG